MKESTKSPEWRSNVGYVVRGWRGSKYFLRGTLRGSKYFAWVQNLCVCVCVFLFLFFVFFCVDQLLFTR